MTWHPSPSAVNPAALTLQTLPGGFRSLLPWTPRMSGRPPLKPLRCFAHRAFPRRQQNWRRRNRKCWRCRGCCRKWLRGFCCLHRGPIIVISGDIWWRLIMMLIITIGHCGISYYS
ncbi:hypothetical protein LINGRAHAP2_LOCUS24832 [Linum grandiflorum]